MIKEREYKTTCVGDYKITIDTGNDVPCVMVWKHLEKDKIENVFGYYSKDVVDFFLTLINKRNEQDQRIAELEEQLAEKEKEIMSKSDESGYIIRFSTMNDREKFNQVIDQQIKELKEKK